MPTNHGTRNAKQKEAFERLFKGLPVVDAENDIRVAVLEEDAMSAIQEDPYNCALAQACKRQFGTQHVAFFRTIAYIELPDEEGNHRVERFTIPDAANKLLANFDLHGTRESGGAFILRAPTTSQRLNYKRKNERKNRQAVLRGEKKIDPKRTAAAKKGHDNRSVMVGEHSLRDGSGMVQFSEDS